MKLLLRKLSLRTCVHGIFRLARISLIKALPRSSEKGTKMVGKMKTTTITTIMGWVVNPNVGRNDPADVLITISLLNAAHFLLSLSIP